MFRSGLVLQEHNVKMSNYQRLTFSNDLLKASNAPAGKLTKLTLTKHQAVPGLLAGSCQTTCCSLHPLTRGELQLSRRRASTQSIALQCSYDYDVGKTRPKWGSGQYSAEKGEETFRVLHLTCYRPDLWTVCQHNRLF